MNEIPGVGPDCCELGGRNLRWFPASPPAGAWHPATPLRDATTAEPVSEPLRRCPFCGAVLTAP